jgi:hypothetical protein
VRGRGRVRNFNVRLFSFQEKNSTVRFSFLLLFGQLPFFDSDDYEILPLSKDPFAPSAFLKIHSASLHLKENYKDVVFSYMLPSALF